MTSSIIQIGRTRLGVDRKQLINSRHNARRDTILRTEFQRLNKLSARVRPTAGMHDLGSAHLFMSGVAITLQDAFELSQKSLGTVTSTPEPEIEHYLGAGLAVLPQVGLMVFASTVMHLHAHWRFIGLDIRAADQLTTDGRRNGREQLTHSHDPSIQRGAADLEAGLPFQNRALTVQRQVVTILCHYGIDHHPITG